MGNLLISMAKLWKITILIISILKILLVFVFTFVINSENLYQTDSKNIIGDGFFNAKSKKLHLEVISFLNINNLRKRMNPSSNFDKIDFTR